MEKVGLSASFVWKRSAENISSELVNLFRDTLERAFEGFFLWGYICRSS